VPVPLLCTLLLAGGEKTPSLPFDGVLSTFFGVDFGVADDCFDGLACKENFGGVDCGVICDFIFACGLGVVRLIEGEDERSEWEEGDFEIESDDGCLLEGVMDVMRDRMRVGDVSGP
jgi:hypothetical protein